MADQLLHGSSLTSFEDAATQAMGEQHGSHEQFEIVKLAIERGGIVGQTQFHATLTRSNSSENGDSSM